MLIRSVRSGLTKLHHKKYKTTIARENCWTGPQNDGDWVPTHPLLQGATIPGRKSRSMLVTWWLLPSVLVLPPSLAVTLTYLPISPSPPMRKGAESTLWERIETQWNGKNSRTLNSKHFFFHNIAFWFFPLIWTTSDLLRQLPINFQISTNHATEFPAFSTKYFQGMMGGIPVKMIGQIQVWVTPGKDVWTAD